MTPSRFYPTAILAVIIAQFLFVFGYVQTEQTIYFWDHAMYYTMATIPYQASLSSLSTAFSVFLHFFENDYNLLFAPPSFIGFWGFGENRTTFILSNFLAFFLLHEIALAFLLKKATALNWKKALLFSLIATSLIPPLWVPLLQGYPDNSAAAFLCFAFGLLLDKERTSKRAIAIGLCLALSFLFRRHYAYGVIALLFSFGLRDVFFFLKEKTSLKRLFIFYATITIFFLSPLFLIAPDFFIRAAATDYAALYHSYKSAPLIFPLHVLGAFGALLSSLAALGFFAFYKTNATAKIIGGTLLTWLVLWSVGPAQLGPHYVLQLLPIFFLFGLYGLAKSTLTPLIKKAVFFCLCLNAFCALWFAPDAYVPNWVGTPCPFSAPHPPVIRQDLSELLALITYINETRRPEDRVLALGSSFVFNQDILRTLYIEKTANPLNFTAYLQAPEIDNVQPFPVDELASATIFIVPTPPQYHLDPAGQEVVTAAFSFFPPQAPFSDFFKKDEKEFKLKDNVTLSIWRRTKPWTPEVLHSLQNFVGQSAHQAPFKNKDWIIEKQSLRSTVMLNENNSFTARGLFDSSWRFLSLFHDKKLSAGSFILSAAFSVQLPCSIETIKLRATTPDGQKSTETVFDYFGSQTVQKSFKLTNDSFISLDFSMVVPNSFSGACFFSAQNIQIQAL